jgi:hypothetical protein
MARGIEVDVVSQSLEITIKTLNKYKGVKWAVATDKQN